MDCSSRQSSKKPSYYSSYSQEFTIEQTSIGMLSDRQFMKLETKFITHLNQKYIKNTVNPSESLVVMPNDSKPTLLSHKEKPVEIIKKPEKKIDKKNIIPSIVEEKKENIQKKHKNHHKLKIDINQKNSFNKEAVPSPQTSKKMEEKKNVLKLVRCNTMSPSKPSIKPRYSDESPRKKYRVKFNKKDEVFKVENFKEELRQLKMFSPY